MSAVLSSKLGSMHVLLLTLNEQGEKRLRAFIEKRQVRNRKHCVALQHQHVISKKNVSGMRAGSSFMVTQGNLPFKYDSYFMTSKIYAINLLKSKL